MIFQMRLYVGSSQKMLYSMTSRWIPQVGYHLTIMGCDFRVEKINALVDTMRNDTMELRVELSKHEPQEGHERPESDEPEQIEDIEGATPKPCRCCLNPFRPRTTKTLLDPDRVFELANFCERCLTVGRTRKHHFHGSGVLCVHCGRRRTHPDHIL